jgi:hypothetical protein
MTHNPFWGKSQGNPKLGCKHCHLISHYVGPRGAPRAPGHAAIDSNQRKTVMINIVLALTLTATALASVPVAAAEQEKDRCVLTEDAADKIADCQKLPRKNASLFDELARRNRSV